VAKARYYVVWKGRKRGVFSSWTECERQVKGFQGAAYKAFETAAEAKTALSTGYEHYRGKSASLGRWKRSANKPRTPSLCADAACSGSPGWLEYQVVETETGQQVLRAGPFAQGTNNVGEFLAIVEAIRWLHRQRLPWPVYSDSENAITWVRNGRCNTRLERTAANRRLFESITRAEADLHALPRPSILKWDTRKWGEIPADFGRK